MWVSRLRDILFHIDLAMEFVAGFDRDTFESDPRTLCGHALLGDHFRSISPLAGRFEDAAPGHRVEADGWRRECLSPRL
jgi:hypothetical protein